MVQGGCGGGRGHHQCDPHDIENEELRRQLQQLTERLERLETHNHHNDGQASDEDGNPFHLRALDEESSEEGRNRHGDQLNDRVFDYKEVPDHRKVKIVAIKLTMYASAWWEQLTIRRERIGKSKIQCWDKMKIVLRLPTDDSSFFHIVLMINIATLIALKYPVASHS
ncbi:hypothetical protein ACFX2J_013719 [Malus domestica]